MNPNLLFPALLVFAAAPLCAQSYLLGSTGSGSVYPYNGNTSSVETVYPIGHYNVGFEFMVGGTALSVTSLGFYDSGGDGFNYAHDVGLWDLSGNLLGAAHFDAATTYPLVNGFAFKPVSPVTLQANTSYVLSAVWNAISIVPQDALHFNPSGSGLALNGATLVGDRYGDFSNNPTLPLAFPSGTNWSSDPGIGSVSGFTTPPLAGGVGASYVGANMQFTTAAVPEPAACGAILGAAMLGFAILRRRKAA